MPEPLFEQNKSNLKKAAGEPAPDTSKETPGHPLSELQQKVGNRAVQRLIQREGSEATKLDEETAGKINASRGGGQRLDTPTQENMGASMGYDFNDVRVHTSPESDQLNKSMGAQAFTTGSDIFFSDGAYDPGSSSGQELLAHELTHVVQQGTGTAGSGGGGMTVNAPGDRHEQEADAVAKSITSPGPAAPVQAQEEEEIQLQEEEEEVQLQEEEEELLQTQPLEEEEEELMP